MYLRFSPTLGVISVHILTFQGPGIMLGSQRFQQVTSMYPKTMMTNKRVMQFLVQRIVEPVWQANWTACAFRMQWRNDADQTQSVWDNIVSHQSQMDDIIKAVDGISLFVSSITGTTSWQYYKPDHPKVVYPALAYWLAVPMKDFDSLTQKLFYHLGVSPILGASVKQLTCDSTNIDSLAKSLFLVLKDAFSGRFIEKKTDDSARFTQVTTRPGQQPIAKVWYTDDCISEVLDCRTLPLHAYVPRITAIKFSRN